MSFLVQVPSDANGNRLLDRGTELFTKRFTSVDSTTGIDLSLPVDCKEVWIHKEGSAPIFTFTGTVSGSKAVTLTSDGSTVVLPLCVLQDIDIVKSLKAPSSTMTLSVIAWR